MGLGDVGDRAVDAGDRAVDAGDKDVDMDGVDVGAGYGEVEEEGRGSKLEREWGFRPSSHLASSQLLKAL